jgi:cell division transport system permease protein
MVTFFRAIRFAFQDILRNFSLSIMTILILVLMLLSLNTLLIVRVLTVEATQTVKDLVDVSVFFSKTATTDDVNEIREYIRTFPEVIDEKYFTPEEVLLDFKAQYAYNQTILSSLDELGDNPLGSMLIIKTRATEDYQKIISALSVPEYEKIIEAKTFSDTEKAISRIHTITSQVEKFSVVVTGLFGLIAFIIIFNTVRVAIYTQRTEIAIKKLVGASNWFVRSPYIIEAFIFTLLSMAITVGVMYGAVILLDPRVAFVFGEANILTNYFTSHILVLVGGQALAVLVLTVTSSVLAMGKYLRS